MHSLSSNLPETLLDKLFRVADDLAVSHDADSFIKALDENARLWELVRQIEPNLLSALPPHFQAFVKQRSQTSFVCFDDEEVDALIKINRRLSSAAGAAHYS